MTSVWRPRFDGESASAPAPLAMPPLIWKLLKARNLTSSEDIQNLLSPSLKSLTDPLKISDMDLAVARLKRAWENQENICVYGDYDLDGSSGIALLVDGLEGLGFENVSFYQPSRFIEGYGIHKEALKTIYDRGDRVVISVDCGITAVEEAVYAKELGLDLIITDHHLPREILPQCVAVINPNKGTCSSDLGHMSGVGVAFYLIMALKRELKVEFDLKSLLDLFTIGTITDMVPLIKENRVLLKHGLKILSTTQRPGLQALIQQLGLLGRELESQDVSFSIGPKLNALSRLEKGIRPLDVFMCHDPALGQALAVEVIKLNEERKQIQETMLQKIQEQLTPEELEKPAMVLAAEGHAGVVGLVATKVSQQTGKPTFIVAWSEGEGIGSARGEAHHVLPAALNEATAFLDRHGGHAQAAGFSLQGEKFQEFKNAVLRFYEDKNHAAVVSETVFDLPIELSDINDAVMGWLEKIGPYGSANPQPVFHLKNPPVSKFQWLKEVHLKIQFGSLEGICFFAKDRLTMPPDFAEAEYLVEPSWNYWKGQRRIQLIIRDIRPSS